MKHFENQIPILLEFRGMEKPVTATLHPSAILRAQDETTSHTLFQFMKQDIALAHELASQS